MNKTESGYTFMSIHIHCVVCICNVSFIYIPFMYSAIYENIYDDDDGLVCIRSSAWITKLRTWFYKK